MRRPQAAEEYITVVDNKGREHFQRVEYIVTDVPLHEVFSWAYAHFILKDELAGATPQPAHAGERISLTRRVLEHALAGV